MFCKIYFTVELKFRFSMYTYFQFKEKLYLNTHILFTTSFNILSLAQIQGSIERRGGKCRGVDKSVEECAKQNGGPGSIPRRGERPPNDSVCTCVAPRAALEFRTNRGASTWGLRAANRRAPGRGQRRGYRLRRCGSGMGVGLEPGK